MNSPHDILESYRDGRISADAALTELQHLQITNLAHSRIDHSREPRTGSPEVIYGEGKSARQIIDIMLTMIERRHNVLATRIDDEKAALIGTAIPEAVHHADARMVTVTLESKKPAGTFIAVVSAGTSDQCVAEEAAVTAEFLGSRVKRFYDCGVAGLHRLLKEMPEIRQARAIIAVAGMEGALPSVLAGLVRVPIIAVPTSVGYGANLQGVTTLLSMLTSCANGVSVVNIDNGFGAGYNAHIINML